MKSIDPSHLARESEFFDKNNLGRPWCRLCNSVCRDEANFVKHLEGITHRKNLERRERAQRIADARKEQERSAHELAVQKDRTAAGLDLLSSATNRKQQAVYGKPTFRYRTEPDAATHQCRVWVDVDYSNLAEDTRPLHRWMTAYEQTVDPVDPEFVYVLFAALGYETIAFRFPSSLKRTTTEDVATGLYNARWDPMKKLYSLFFVLG